MLVHTRYSINVSGLAIANYFLSKTEIFEKKKKKKTAGLMTGLKVLYL